MSFLSCCFPTVTKKSSVHLAETPKKSAGTQCFCGSDKENYPIDIKNVISLDESDRPKWIQSQYEQETLVESPIDININRTVKLNLPRLVWHNHDHRPNKWKMINNGTTLMITSNWLTDQPYITGGPFLNNYMFSQIHFHWGRNNSEGSEHTVENCKYPGEMHAVYFKVPQDKSNEMLDPIVKHIHSVRKAHTFIYISSDINLKNLLCKFGDDYFMYWGSFASLKTSHNVLWLVCRTPLGISNNQLEQFRTLLNPHHRPISKNFREVDISDHTDKVLFYINPLIIPPFTLLPLNIETHLPTIAFVEADKKERRHRIEVSKEHTVFMCLIDTNPFLECREVKTKGDRITQPQPERDTETLQAPVEDPLTRIKTAEYPEVIVEDFYQRASQKRKEHVKSQRKRHVINERGIESPVEETHEMVQRGVPVETLFSKKDKGQDTNLQHDDRNLQYTVTAVVSKKKGVQKLRKDIKVGGTTYVKVFDNKPTESKKKTLDDYDNIQYDDEREKK